MTEHVLLTLRGSRGPVVLTKGKDRSPQALRSVEQ